jgi:cytochrome c
VKPLLLVAAVGLWLGSGAACAQDDELYKTKNCFACHRIDRNHLGPSFQAVAARHREDPGADAKLARKIREGTAGAWGQTPMPAQAQVTEEEALTLARWILQLK